MAIKEDRVYHIDPNSELGKLIDEKMDDTDILLELHGLEFRIVQIVPEPPVPKGGMTIDEWREKYGHVWTKEEAEDLREYLFGHRSGDANGYESESS
jgi:hypothetical protein